MGDIKPDSGFNETMDSGAYCEQRTDNIPDKFGDFLESWNTEVFRLKGQLDIEFDWQER
ncbi:MAG: hypothetical protein HOD92_10000 [Deltaproteobacteria bacterium]|nr:hypothetical protein [Deltaproteobacteria bacterium]